MVKNKHIFIPTQNAEDWKQFLAEPQKQWREDYSARSLAYAWESVPDFPPEFKRIFSKSDVPAFHQLEMLLAIPEYKVPMPGKGYASQNDLFVLAKAADRLITIMVEGKTKEPFGETLATWLAESSENKLIRLKGIQHEIGIAEIPPTTRYQLLHRTASAMLTAKKFNARYAAVIIYSFSPINIWFEDYQAFLKLYGVDAAPNTLYFLKEIEGVQLYSGWVKGSKSEMG